MTVLPKLAIAATIAVTSLTGMAFAKEYPGPSSTFSYTPAECSVQGTKTAHPDWYRLGGYCDPYTSDKVSP